MESLDTVYWLWNMQLNKLHLNTMTWTYLDSVGSYSSAYQRSLISFIVNLQENFTPR